MKIIGLQKGEKKQPGSDHFERGIALWDEEKIEDALAEFKRAIEEGFDNDSIQNDIGACLDKLGLVEEARKHYLAAIQRNPYNFYAHKNLGLSYLADDQFEKVDKHLTISLALNPDDNEVRIALGRALIEFDKPEKAVRLMSMVIKRSKSIEEIIGALEVMQSAAAYIDILRSKEYLDEKAFELGEINSIFGEASFELGFGDDSVNYFKKLLELDPDPVNKSWLGMALMASDKKEEGLKFLKDAEKEGGDHPQVLQNVAFAFHGADLLEEALVIYKRAADIMPGDWVIWNNWGNALYNLGRYSESIPKFVIALEKNPDYEIAWNNIGNALEKMKMHEESLPFHLRAIEIDDGFAYAHYAAAVAYTALGKKSEAESEIRKTMERQPAFSEIWIFKAKMKLLSNPEDAMLFASKAAEIDTDSAEVLMVQATAKSLAGMHDEAEVILRKARALAVEQDDSESLHIIDELLEKGPYSSEVLKKMTGFQLQKEPEMDEDIGGESDDSMYWYRLGSDLLSKKRYGRALDAFRISSEIDGDSAASLSKILKLETDARRLREHIQKSNNLQTRRISTPEMERAVESASKKIGRRKKAR